MNETYKGTLIDDVVRQQGVLPGRRFLAAIVILTIAAAVIRLLLLDYQTQDYRGSLKQWYNFIVEHGRFAAFGYHFSDYSPPYLYLLSLATWLPLKPLWSIKLISLIFDAAIGVLVFYLFQLRSRNAMHALWCAAMILLSPTVVLNGALWGQCDIIFTFFVILALFYLAQGRPALACVAYGVAFSFKLQAIFIFPLFATLVLLKRISVLHLTVIPWIYAVLSLPCVLAGRSLESVMLIYATQATQYGGLTLNAANIYQWLPKEWDQTLHDAGIIVAGVISALLVVAFFYKHRRSAKAEMRLEDLLLMALTFAVLEPFFLPRMHERYFFTADVISILYVLCRPRHWFVAVLINGASLIAYCPFAFGFEPVKLSYAAIINAAVLAFLIREWLRLRLHEPVKQDSCTTMAAATRS